MENLIINETKNILQAKNVEIVERLLGGMSNYTYVINADNIFYTFRYPGEFSEFFVDRVTEKKNIEVIEQLNLTNQTVYLNVNNGYKIAKYVKGTSLNLIDPSNYPLEKIAQILKKIHNSGLTAVNNYDPFRRLDNYENHIKELGFVHPEKYNSLKECYLKYKEKLESYPKVLCHGDSQPSNFIIADDELIIVDFEFCGNNDVLYDIACFSNMRLEDGLNLLNVYYDTVDNNLLFRFYAWRCFQCFQWFNVAIFKDLKGMSATLKIDFNMVANKYLEKIEILYNEMIKFL